MSQAEPLTDEQREELRRAVEEYEGRVVAGRRHWSAAGACRMLDLLHKHRHAILATADRLATQTRRMRKGVG